MQEYPFYIKLYDQLYST